MPPLHTAFGLRTSGFRLLVSLLPLLLALNALGASESNRSPNLPPRKEPRKERPAPAAPELAPPVTPRDFYNAGTRQLQAGKLREAEASLETALASQSERLQPPALYNLGLVRFGQGVEQLKKGPSARPTVSRGQAAAQQADAAIRAAEDALAGNDLQKMVAAYLRGKGARKELKAATRAVQQALKMHGAVLAKWERASGDFKGALELNRAHADARHNADVVDRCIARLVDSLQELQQCANGMCDKGQQLGDSLKGLKGRVPAPDMPPGAAGEDEEEEEAPLGNLPGQQEGSSREGKEMEISPEQAGWLLEAYKLDTERRLPMGQGPMVQPADRPRPPW